MRATKIASATPRSSAGTLGDQHSTQRNSHHDQMPSSSGAVRTPPMPIVDLIEWLASGERSYKEVMDAWSTSCPNLPVWEDANDLGLVCSEQIEPPHDDSSDAGLARLEQRSTPRNNWAQKSPDQDNAWAG